MGACPIRMTIETHIVIARFSFSFMIELSECGCVDTNIGLFCWNTYNMEIFSLEDDGRELFLTQQTQINRISDDLVGENVNEFEAVSNLASLTSAPYSDISDDDIVFPSSQKRNHDDDDVTRLVMSRYSNLWNNFAV